MVRCLHPIRVICALIVLTACSTVPQVGAPPASPPARLVTPGLEVTPLEVPPDDVAKILQMRRWKFRVVIPHANGERGAAAPDQEVIHFTYQVELRQAGQDPVVLAEHRFGITHRIGEPGQELLIALFPVEQRSTHDDQMQLYLDGFVTVIDNPLKGHQGFAMRSDPAAIQPDGSFLLIEMGTNKGENIFPSPDNRQLVFSLTRVDQP